MDYVVCDTDVVSEIRDRRPRAAGLSVLRTAVKVISVVTAAELRAGALIANWGTSRRDGLETTIRAYPQLAIDEETAHVWARLRSETKRLGRNVGHNDLWIAATATRMDVPVVSFDGDLARIPGIRLIDASGEERRTT